VAYLRAADGNAAGFLAEAKIREYIRCLTDDRVRFIQRFVTAFFDDGGRTAKRPPRTRTVAQAAAASVQGVLQGLTATATTDLRAFTIPTLVMHGANDAVLPPERTGVPVPVADAVAGSRLVLLPGAPHGLNVTRAAEFNRELSAFLEG
jgi:pimeloyl-ACP methyl ester carboxylesterase